jgi:uncharacterized tellurite resistance protein B-like protein
MSLFSQLLCLFKSERVENESSEDQPRLSRAVLLLEAANYDDDYDPRERRLIESLLAEKYDLKPQETQHLLELARQHRDHFPDAYEHIRQINTELSFDERVALMEELWMVLFADDHLDAKEDHFAKKMRTLLRLDLEDWARARQRAKVAIQQRS